MKKELKNISYFAVFFAAISIFWLFKFFIPFVGQNNLLIWDMVGHYYSAFFTAEYLFPHVIGWNPFFFLGFPQNQFYPPLFVYLAALLAQFFTLELVFKFLVVFAVFITPLAFYFFGRSFDLSKKSAAVFMVVGYALMFLPDMIISQNGTPGGTFTSTFNIGLVPHGFILPFLFIYLGVLYRDLKRQRYLLAALLLAGIIIGHIIVGITAIIFSLVVVATQLKQRENLVAGIKLLVLSFLLTSFWTIPFLTKLSFTNSIIIYLGTSPYFLLISLAFVVVSLYLLRQKPLAPRLIIYSLIALYSMVIILDYFTVHLHLNRFNFFIFIFTAYLILYYWQSVAVYWRRWGYYGSIGLAVLLIIIFQGRINTVGTTNIFFEPITAPDGRVLVLTSFYRDETIHVPRYTIQRQSGVEVVKGLFVESAKNARIINNLEKELNLRAFDWGLATDWEQIREFSLYREGEFIPAHLDLFNINYIVANFLFPAETEGFSLLRPVGVDYYQPSGDNQLPGLTQPVDFQFYLHRVNDSQRFDVLTYQPVTFQGGWQEWENAVVDWFFSEAIDRVMVYAPASVVVEPGRGDEAVKLIDHTPSWDRFSLEVAAERDVPVLLKMSYFPNWQAFVDGQRIPIYLASPYLMLITTHGTVEFRYLPTVFDRAGTFLSLFGLLWLTLGLIFFTRRFALTIFQSNPKRL